jgi:hypothetical protein
LRILSLSGSGSGVTSSSLGPYQIADQVIIVKPAAKQVNRL